MSAPHEKPEATTPPSPTPARRPHAALRVVAGAVGLLVFAVGGLLTLGTALAAPLGMGTAWWLARRRGHRLTRGGSWLGAVGGATLAVAILLIVGLSYAPGGYFDIIQSAPAARPPAWLERLSPPNPTADRLVQSRPFAVYIGLLGGAFACFVLGSISGTVGWGSTLLLGYAATGRWPVHADSLPSLGSGGVP